MVLIALVMRCPSHLWDPAVVMTRRGALLAYHHLLQIRIVKAAIPIPMIWRVTVGHLEMNITKMDQDQRARLQLPMSVSC